MTMRFRQTLATTGCVVLASILVGCSGGGGGGGGGTPTPTPPSGGGGGGSGGGGSNNPQYTPGVYEASSEFADRCEMPRPGTSDVDGSVALENFWLRSYSDETYLWYDEIPDLNPYSYNDPLDYFDLLKTDATTSSGVPVDQFHFTYDTEEYQQLVNSGEEVQYGAEFAILRSTPPRDIRVAYVQDGSPADSAGVTRGMKILTIDGQDAINGNTQATVDALNEGLFPSTQGETHTFRLEGPETDPIDVSLTAQVIAVAPVQTTQVIDDGGDQVGYLHLTTFGTVNAEQQLITAINEFSAEGVSDLVLDLRYNGGGFLDIASELGYMIAGAQSEGDIFQELVFNDKNPNTNPVTGQPLSPTLFHTTSQGFSVAAGQALPSLDLNRVYILATDATCSASEAVINALEGIDVEVVLIGSRTCGKPYGFYGTDNCGTTYFTIQFRGENAKGFGDYAAGFSPGNGGVGEPVPGCGVGDDFANDLGDPNESMLSTALAYRNTGVCPSGSSASGITTASASRTPWTTEEPALFLSNPERYRYIDPSSLYASERFREKMRRERVRDLTLNRPVDAMALREEGLE